MNIIKNAFAIFSLAAFATACAGGADMDGELVDVQGEEISIEEKIDSEIEQHGDQRCGLQCVAQYGYTPAAYWCIMSCS